MQEPRGGIDGSDARIARVKHARGGRALGRCTHTRTAHARTQHKGFPCVSKLVRASDRKVNSAT